MSGFGCKAIKHVCYSPGLLRCSYLSLVLGILSFTLVLLMSLCSPPSHLWGSFRSARLLQWSSPDTPSPRESCSSPAVQEKVPLVAVNGTHTLMVSAYLEHRYPRWEVRVISIVQRSETVVYQCRLCCAGQIHNSTAYYNIHSDHFGYAYGIADIMCPVPSACVWPNHITVYSGPLSENMDPPSPFIPVQNQHPWSDGDFLPINFTVCISTMFNFDNVLQLVQALEMFRLLGVGRVAIYRTSCSLAVQRVLDYYTQTGLVEIIPWTVSSHLNVSRGWQSSVSPGEVHYHGQLAALNDCVYRYMYQSRYLALQDIDELILPLAVDNWYELLPQLEHKHGTNVGYKFENSVFRNTVRLRDMNNSTTEVTHVPVGVVAQWPHVPGVNILDHLYREPENKQSKSNFKIIVNPRAVFATTVHGLLNSQRDCVWVDTNVARLFHTREPWSSELSLDQLIYDDRILHYAVHLVPAVSEVLSKTRQED